MVAVDYSLMALVMVNSTIGALLNVLLWSKTPEDITKWSSVKAIIVGTIIGYLYYWGEAIHGFPDSFMSIIAGYTGQDFINWVISKAPWKKGSNSTPAKRV